MLAADSSQKGSGTLVRCSTGSEPLGGVGHVQRLVRAGRVVLRLPGVHHGLGGVEAVERAVRVEQFDLDGLMPALHFPRGSGTAGFRQSLGDAVVPTNPFKQHLGRARRAEPCLVPSDSDV